MRRDQSILLRAYPSDLKAVRRAAQLAGLPTMVWCRRILRNAAEKALALDTLAQVGIVTTPPPAEASDVVLDALEGTRSK